MFVIFLKFKCIKLSWIAADPQKLQPLNSMQIKAHIAAVLHVHFHSAVSTTLQPPSSITRGATATASVSVSWSQVPGATGYYVSYQRQDLGAPPVVTPLYERFVGGDTSSATLSGLEPGTTYRIRVWSTDGTSVSSETGKKDVTTMESGETWHEHVYISSNTCTKTLGKLLLLFCHDAYMFLF